jgi:hypothetical protein
MLTHADIRHLILAQKWVQDGHAFTVESVQRKITEVALQKGLMKPKQQHENVTEVDRLFPSVIWELLLREIFAPGRVGHPNETLPSLVITPYGEECMKVGELTPNDPDGYLKRIVSESPTVDPVTILYLGEALQTFKFGNFLATAVMVGVAAESMDDPSDVGPRVSRDLAEDAIATVREIVECWTEQREAVLFSDGLRKDHKELADASTVQVA